MAATLEKHKDESRVYDFDFTDQKEIAAGETLTGTPTVSATPTGLTVGSPVIGGAGKKVQVRLSGGMADTVYSLTCLVQTSGGNTLQGCGSLSVTEC